MYFFSTRHISAHPLRAVGVALFISSLIWGCAPKPPPTLLPGLLQPAEMMMESILPDTNMNTPVATADTLMPPLEAARSDVPTLTQQSQMAFQDGPVLWSVQIFASATETNANEQASVARQSSHPVEVVQESDGQWKVYVGRAPTRETIDTIRDEMRSGSFPDAWSRERRVMGAIRDGSIPAGTFVWSVQVYASLTQSRAEEVVEQVRPQVDRPVEILQIGGLWKVFVGRESTREPIDHLRDKLRAMAYPDAWTYERRGDL